MAVSPPTVTAFSTGLKVSSGNGNVIILRPSAVIGLLTNVSVGSKNNTSSAQAGVKFQVSVSGSGSPKVTPSQPITFADRYIQISTNLFQAISSQCSLLTNGCYFNFNETTLDAHSFDWVVENLSAGDYQLTVSWTPATATTTGGTALACVGPVMYTAEQAKTFSPSAGLSY